MAVIDVVIIKRVQEAVQALSKNFGVQAAYIFGSQAEGTADYLSDIDLAVFIDGLKEWDLQLRIKTTVRIQKEFGDDLELHFFPSEIIDNPPSASLVAYILSHGIPIPLK
jgi:predicted nucleotidyltransferase